MTSRNRTARGTLYVVATPIGNLEDLTRRAERILSEVDLVAAEDTRRTRQLLSHLGIGKPLVSYREQNRESAARQIISRLLSGQDAALVTDAGTPGVSDPGTYLVAEAAANGIQVVPVPGPSALAAALSASGIPVDRFLFEGFLPAKAGPRKARLQKLAAAGFPIVLYESPRRVVDTLKDLLDILGNRDVVLARELTKVHEELFRGRASEVLKAVERRNLKGEVTLVVSGGEPRRDAIEVEPLVRKLRDAGLSASQTAAVLAEITGQDRREIYRLASGTDAAEGGRNDG